MCQKTTSRHSWLYQGKKKRHLKCTAQWVYSLFFFFIISALFLWYICLKIGAKIISQLHQFFALKFKHSCQKTTSRHSWLYQGKKKRHLKCTAQWVYSLFFFFIISALFLWYICLKIGAKIISQVHQFLALKFKPHDIHGCIKVIKGFKMHCTMGSKPIWRLICQVFCSAIYEI